MVNLSGNNEVWYSPLVQPTCRPKNGNLFNINIFQYITGTIFDILYQISANDKRWWYAVILCIVFIASFGMV